MDWKIKSIGNFDQILNRLESSIHFFKSFGKFDQFFESNTFHFDEFLGVANFCLKIRLNV